MNIKILNITTVPQSMGFFRGLITFLQKRGFDVALCSSPGERLQQVGDSENATTFSVPMTRAITPWQDLKSLWGLYRVMRRYRPTIVNASTPKAGLLGMIAAWLAGVSVRVYLHRGLRLETTKGVKYLLLWTMDKLACTLSNCVIAISRSLQEKLIHDRIVSRKKIKTFREGSSNGLDVPKYTYSVSLMREAVSKKNELGIDKTTQVIGFVGRIVRDKGMQELQATFARILESSPDVVLVLIGPKEQEDQIDDQLYQWLADHPKVIMTGRVFNVPVYYGLMDVLAFPSYREGFGNVVLEAAAMGVPTVGFDATGVRDAVADGETGTLVPMKDSNAMAESIIKYLDDPKLRFQHALQGRKRVIRDFQPPMIWEAYYQEYCDLLRSKKMEIPKPEVRPLSPELIDADKDEQEFRKWYAVREVLLKNANLTETCRLAEVKETDIENMISQAIEEECNAP